MIKEQKPSHTLAKEIFHSGIGLHSGISTQVRLLPANSGDGRYFVRVDLPQQPIIPARVGAVHQTTLSTELIEGEATVRTVEHLLAALAGMGVDDVRIEIDGSEVPLLDGSAQIWVEAIAQVGLVRSPSQTMSIELPIYAITEPIWVNYGDAFVAALPAPTTCFSYGIDFDFPAIGQQWHTWHPERDSFATTIAPARTFGLANQIEQLRAAGLIKGGTLANALVCSATGWLNPPLRFENEPVRHKILDLLGDLSLLATWPIAHFLAYKASHNLHIQLAQKIVALTSPIVPSYPKSQVLH